jgi:anti-sigma factor RsiW
VTDHPHDLHAFALGDLTGAVEAEVARHVAGCARCRREVRRLRAEHAATVEALPPLAPSPEARARTLAAARAAMTAAATPAVPPDRIATPRPPAPARATRGRRLPAWSGWALAWVVAVAAVGLSWERHAAWRASEADRTLVAGWLTRDDVTTWPLPAAAGARSPGTVMVADDGVVLVVMRAPAPAGRAYRTWGVGPEGATALADVPRTVLRAPAAGFDEIVVSLEPRRATSAPTDPLGAAPLPTPP